jgi:hypothetical protein
MVFDDIMDEVKRKYELRPRLNVPKFKREDVLMSLDNDRREEPKVPKISRKR